MFVEWHVTTRINAASATATMTTVAAALSVAVYITFFSYHYMALTSRRHEVKLSVPRVTINSHIMTDRAEILFAHARHGSHLISGQEWSRRALTLSRDWSTYTVSLSGIYGPTTIHASDNIVQSASTSTVRCFQLIREMCVSYGTPRWSLHDASENGWRYLVVFPIRRDESVGDWQFSTTRSCISWLEVFATHRRKSGLLVFSTTTTRRRLAWMKQSDALVTAFCPAWRSIQWVTIRTTPKMHAIAVAYCLRSHLTVR